MGRPHFRSSPGPTCAVMLRNSQRLRCLLAAAPELITQLLRAPCSRGIEAGNPSEGNVQGPHLHSSHKLPMMQTVELCVGAPLLHKSSTVSCRSAEAFLGKDSWKERSVSA